MTGAAAHQLVEEEGAIGRRRRERSRVLLPATIETFGGEYPVKLRDLSCLGAMVESDYLPPVDSSVIFKRGATEAASRVVWVMEKRIGLEFMRPIAEAEVLLHVRKPATLQAISAPSGYRRPGRTSAAA